MQRRRQFLGMLILTGTVFLVLVIATVVLSYKQVNDFILRVETGFLIPSGTLAVSNPTARQTPFYPSNERATKPRCCSAYVSWNKKTGKTQVRRGSHPEPVLSHYVLGLAGLLIPWPDGSVRGQPEFKGHQDAISAGCQVPIHISLQA